MWPYQDEDPEPIGAGDVNGDGLADILVVHGAQGRAWVVFGKDDMSPVDVLDIESGLGGFSISEVGGIAADPLLGDIDGDGLGEIGLWTSSWAETRVIMGAAASAGGKLRACTESRDRRQVRRVGGAFLAAQQSRCD